MAIKDTPTFVKFTPFDDGKGLNVSVSLRTMFKKKQNGLACFLPGFNIFFFAKDQDAVKAKSIALSKMYLDHYLSSDMKHGLRKLVLELRKKGFTSENNTSTIHSLINNKIVPAKFKSAEVIPLDFKSAESFNQNANFAIAV